VTVVFCVQVVQSLSSRGPAAVNSTSLFDDQLRHADEELERATASLALVHLHTDAIARQVRVQVHSDISHDVLITRNLSSPVDMCTRAGSAFDNCRTLTFDLLTAESIHALYVYQVLC